MSNHLDRGVLLLQQSRFDLAEESLRKAVVDDPQDAHAHALLGICLGELKKYDEATSEVREGVRLAPDHWFSHYAHALVMIDRNRKAEARQAAGEAVRLNPHDPSPWGVLASIEFASRQWAKALEAAEHGLQIDPQDGRCTNLRAMALVKLGRAGEAGDTIDTALADDPEDSLTQANKGWVLLERGKPREAQTHFREALRLDPTCAYARSGMVTALKAVNPFYRLMLNYFLWMSKLSSGVQWGLIIGLYVGFRMIRNIARANPELSPYLMPLVVAYLVFVVSTWMADPISNLLLRLNTYGRYLLSRDETMGANLVGGCILLAVAAVVLGLTTGNEDLLFAALAAGLLMLPVSAIYRCNLGWPRLVMGSAAGLLAFLAVTGFAVALAGLPGAVVFSGLAIIGNVISSWAGSALMLAEVRR